MLSLEEIKKAQEEVNAVLKKYSVTLNVVHQVNLVDAIPNDGAEEAKVVEKK